jgi:hypothetical protein
MKRDVGTNRASDRDAAGWYLDGHGRPPGAGSGGIGRWPVAGAPD